MKKGYLFSITIIIILLLLILISLLYYCIHSVKINIDKIFSISDFDNDGIVDSEEFIIGARKEVKNKTSYVNKYYADGYPPNNEGVCTDVVWRAFWEAGYVLREMVDNDIREHIDEYYWIENIDNNIDFRRVRNLEVFFDRYAKSLTIEIIPNDPANLVQWQGGDLVIFGEYEHIAIISDKRNPKGIPYIIHNSSTYAKEEDALILLKNIQGITKHYRFSE